MCVCQFIVKEYYRYTSKANNQTIPQIGVIGVLCRRMSHKYSRRAVLKHRRIFVKTPFSSRVVLADPGKPLQKPIRGDVARTSCFMARIFVDPARNTFTNKLSAAFRA